MPEHSHSEPDVGPLSWNDKMKDLGKISFSETTFASCFENMGKVQHCGAQYSTSLYVFRMVGRTQKNQSVM